MYAATSLRGLYVHARRSLPLHVALTVFSPPCFFALSLSFVRCLVCTLLALPPARCVAALRWTEHVGGPAHSYVLLELLETLAGVEEGIVRDKAVASIKNIAKVGVPACLCVCRRGGSARRSRCASLPRLGLPSLLPAAPRQCRAAFVLSLHLSRARARAQGMKAEAVLKYVLPLVRQLAIGDWYTSRISACALVAPVYPAVGDVVRKELRR